MKKLLNIFGIAAMGAAFALLGFYLLNGNEKKLVTEKAQAQSLPVYVNNTVNTAANSGVDFRAAASRTVDAVVHVKNTAVQQVNVWGRLQERELVGTGSGVIISPDGFIVTNNHVIQGANKLQVTLNDNKIYEAELVGTDPTTDIALLKVDSTVDLPYIAFGDSDNVEVGQWVLAVGNPFNLTSTVTAGIVSAKARDLNEQDNNIQSFIQTDAAVNKGNSGGALVNTNGELIGINTAISSGTGAYVGYSFAVPSNNARKVIEDIMQYGTVQRGMLGITGGNLNSLIASELNIPVTNGVYVSGVTDDAHQSTLKLKEGDVIVGIDNVNINQFTDLTGYIGSKSPGDTVDVKLIRNSKELIVPVTLSLREVSMIDDLGLEVRNVGESELQKFDLLGGVRIVGVSMAMKRYEYLTNFIITKINDETVRDVETLKVLLSRYKGQRVAITMIDQEGNQERFVFSD